MAPPVVNFITPIITQFDQTHFPDTQVVENGLKSDPNALHVLYRLHRLEWNVALLSSVPLIQYESSYGRKKLSSFVFQDVYRRANQQERAAIVQRAQPLFPTLNSFSSRVDLVKIKIQQLISFCLRNQYVKDGAVILVGLGAFYLYHKAFPRVTDIFHKYVLPQRVDFNPDTENLLIRIYLIVNSQLDFLSDLSSRSTLLYLALTIGCSRLVAPRLSILTTLFQLRVSPSYSYYFFLGQIGTIFHTLFYNPEAEGLNGIPDEEGKKAYRVWMKLTT